MSDIKFHCDTCGQPILVDAGDVGRTIRCPSCQSALVIRAPKAEAPKAEKPRVKPVLAKPAGPRRKSGGSSGATGVEPVGNRPASAVATPSQQPGDTSVIAPTKEVPSTRPAPAPIRPLPAPPIPLVKPAATAEASRPEPDLGPATLGSPAVVQVAALTPESKLAIVRSAREQLVDPARWMPGVNPQGKFAYAARPEGENLVPVEVGDATATRHSLMGAILLEFQRRNVIATASGRTEFLDREIPAMIREVAPEVGTDSPASTEGPGADAVGLMGISHAQCLAVLEGLARRYEAEARGETSDALRQARGFTVEELADRAAKDELVTNTEIVRAVHRELSDLRERVAALEKTRGS